MTGVTDFGRAGPRLVVLYGSQTGTAEDLAEDLGRRARRRGFRALVQAWDSYDLTSLPHECLLISMVSTTGDGEEPDNMRSAWRFLLRKSLPPDSLQSLKFAVFGLGDTSYPKFNAVARRMQTRLKQLGAQDFAPIGLGDDQSRKGVLGDYDEWCKVMWPALHSLYPHVVAPPGADVPTLEAPRYTCTVVQHGGGGENGTGDGGVVGAEGVCNGNGVHGGGEETCGAQDAEQALDDVPGFYQRPTNARSPSLRPFLARLLVNKRVTPSDWTQESRHFEWDITGLQGSDEGWPYRAGDVAYLYPENPDAAVAAFLQLFGFSEQDVVEIDHSDEAKASGDHLSPLDAPSRCTMRRLAKRYLDIAGVPRRGVLEQLSLFATNDDEKDKLLELASPEGADFFHEYCTREKRSIVEVLQDFPSVRPPLHRLLELIPRIKPRAFSIASSPLPHAHPNRMHLLIAVVRFRTPYKRQREGLCSSYLSQLSPGAAVPLWIRPGSFVVPSSPTTPLIMVGPGTGLAPFRAMIQERHAQRIAPGQQQQHDAVAEEDGPFDHLYFGCRRASMDFYYADELQSLFARSSISFTTAFSRDEQDKGGKRVYVTHRLREAGECVWRLLSERGASLFVAGSAKKMPSDVLSAVKDIVKEHGGVDEKEAERFVMALVRARRYCVESWSG